MDVCGNNGNGLELKIPPVALVLVFALLMWMSARHLGRMNFQIPFQRMLAWTMGILGMGICTLGILEFKRARTTVNPTKPQSTSSLVRSGIYRHTRNPMYLGFLFILAGWAIVMANVVAFAVLPGFVIYMNRFQIIPEERALTSIFGGEFKGYCSTARRWI
jgi:protein-S-isoprenylcysteine O-methyltransferase Ste14